jgi:hypothetical protein
MEASKLVRQLDIQLHATADAQTVGQRPSAASPQLHEVITLNFTGQALQAAWSSPLH